MTDDQILEVVAARKAGKQIQERHLDQEDWHNMRVPHGMWHFSMYEYRVAPEPREYAILNYNDKMSGIGSNTTVIFTQVMSAPTN
jgi:hypothetical protein